MQVVTGKDVSDPMGRNENAAHNDSRLCDPENSERFAMEVGKTSQTFRRMRFSHRSYRLMGVAVLQTFWKTKLATPSYHKVVK